MKPSIILLFLLCVVSAGRAQSVDFYGKAVSPDICNQLGMTDSKEVTYCMDKICAAAGIPNNFTLQPCPNIGNCYAANANGTSYILYDINFFKKVQTYGFTEKSLPNGIDWQALTVLAHELGHHLCQHFSRTVKEKLTPVQMELQADEYAGAIMYKLGASLAQAQAVMYSSEVPEDATTSHPARKDRLEAIAKGWDKENNSHAGRNIVPLNPVANQIAPAAVPQSQSLDLPDMILVEGGTFIMGDKKEPKYSPIGPHKVTVSGFYISKYEITFNEFDAYCTANKREKPDDHRWGRGKNPVINVSWDEATAYCKWLSQQTGKNFRLPTEAEWEFAARGGNKTNDYIYSGSDIKDDVGWNSFNTQKVRPVGEKQPNELGIYDMTGNVAEWCNDWYVQDYYSSSPSLNPQGPEVPLVGSNRIVRGGGINSTALPVYDRDRADHNIKISTIGFRVVCSN